MPSVLKSQRSKRPVAPKQEAKPEIAIPECPAFVCAEGQKEWLRITPFLAKLGLMSHLDTAALAMYCQDYGRWCELETGIESKIKELQISKGMSYAEALFDYLINITPNGYEQHSPRWSILNKIRSDVENSLKSFGLSPSARATVKADMSQLDLFEGTSAAPETPAGWKAFASGPHLQ